MLDAFEILTTSGVVLWSKSYAPVGAHVVNSLINDAFIEEKVRPQAPGASPIFRKERYTLKWKTVKEFDLIFVVSCLVPCTETTRALTFEDTLLRTGRLPIVDSPRMD